MHWRTLVAVAIAMSEAGALAQEPVAQIRITTDPVPAEVNLLKTPGFEQVEDGFPVAWQQNTAGPEHFTYEVVGNARTGSSSFRLAADSGEFSGYVQQNVAIEPGREYRAWTWLRLAGGRYMMLIRGHITMPGEAATHFDERSELISTRNHWLAPLYLNPEHLQGPDPEEWVFRPQSFTAPEGLSAVQMWMGSYFRKAEMWFDDTYLGPGKCTLSLKVEAGQPLQQVWVRDVESGPAIYSSGKLEGNTKTHEAVLEDVPIADGYLVMFETREGRQQAWVLANQ